MFSMATKEEKSDQLNAMLGTDIEYDRLLEDDLNKLIDMVDSGKIIEPAMKHITKRHGEAYLSRMMDSWYPGKYIKEVV